jgi:peroxiredoxin
VIPPLDDRVKALRAEWDAARAHYFEVKGLVKNEVNADKIVEPLEPNVQRYGQRFVELAETDIKSPAARDALLWVVSQFWIMEGYGKNDWSDLIKRSMDLLLEYHADDFLVAWTALGMNRYTSPNRDDFLPSIYEKAKSKRTRGAAALALAQYRWRMGEAAFGRKLEGRPVIRTDTGQTLPMSPEHEAYLVANYERDPNPLRAEAFRLLDEVIRDHGDELYNSRTKTTLGNRARELAEEWANPAVGQPALDFSGKTLDGQPIRLADDRGKVVVLVFWASWSEPSVKQIAKLRVLAEQFQGQPVVILGVNCDEDPEKACKVVRDERITWPSVVEGSRQLGPTEIEMGPIARRYRVSTLPSSFVVDGEGIIRQHSDNSEGLAKSVEDLLKPQEPKLNPGK